MQTDFWNNPLVVSAMRLKFRKSSPGILASLWSLALLGLGALLYKLAAMQGFPFAKTFLIALLAVQFVLCGVIALLSVSSSVNAEVVNRTLDFQRIVSLSPREVLVGKMIGEPAISYFLAAASLPFATICWGLGATSGLAVLAFYGNLATFIILAAALGLIHSLAPPTRTTGRQRGGAGGAVFAMLFVVLPQVVVHGVQVLEVPGMGDALQLLTPVGSFVALWRDNPWSARVVLWNLSIPSLLAAPVVQGATAAWIVAAMARRLKNPNDPAISKRRAYATAAALDLLVAGVCYAHWRQGVAATSLVYGFGLAHVIVCLLLLLAAVPRRQAVLSWIWRRAPSASLLRELALAERSDARLLGVILALIGPAVLAVGLLAPLAASAAPAAAAPPALQAVVQASLVAAVVVVSSALLFQLLSLAVPRGAPMLFILIVVALNILPPIAGAMLGAYADSETGELAAHLSPAAFFGTNMWRVFGQPVGAAALLAVYLLLGAICWRLVSAWIRGQSSIVAGKLARLNLPAASPAA